MEIIGLNRKNKVKPMIGFLSKYFLKRTDDTLIQFFRYVFVGGTAAVVDIGALFLLVNFLRMHYLIAAAIAFLLGAMINFLISIAWVFKSNGNLKKEALLFTLIGVGGLGLNELIIWLMVAKFDLFYVLAKVFSTTVVLFWNFGMRKKFVFAGVIKLNQREGRMIND